MRITQRRLREIIKEELGWIMQEKAVDDPVDTGPARSSGEEEGENTKLGSEGSDDRLVIALFQKYVAEKVANKSIDKREAARITAVLNKFIFKDLGDSDKSQVTSTINNLTKQGKI